jgi:hypothetical protein
MIHYDFSGAIRARKVSHDHVLFFVVVFPFSVVVTTPY